MGGVRGLAGLGSCWSRGLAVLGAGVGATAAAAAAAAARVGCQVGLRAGSSWHLRQWQVLMNPLASQLVHQVQPWPDRLTARGQRWRRVHGRDTL